MQTNYTPAQKILYILNVLAARIMLLLLMNMTSNSISVNQIQPNNMLNRYSSSCGGSCLIFLTVQYPFPLTQSNALLITSVMFFNTALDK